MSWKKHFSLYQGQSTANAKPSGASRFQSWLPEVYSGQPNRVERYAQYDQMDMDSEVNAALDIISEFSTQIDDTTELPFSINYNDDVTESEAKILEQTLRQWCNLQEWDKRIFKTFRNAIKYGDQFFIRDPETWELYYVNPVDVSKCIINEAKGKEPEQYIIKNIDLNMKEKTVSKPVQYGQSYGSVNTMMRGQSTSRGPMGASSADYSNMTGNVQEYNVDATHVVHLGLTEGMDGNFPFGNSILDPIFKTYKQKELLEDSIIIYRVQRAPERRIFKIDVGNMPSHMAMAYVERIKNEIWQRRIPTQTGGGANMMDATYNPLSTNEDYFFPVTADGRGSSVDTLQGGTNLGEITDLRFFTNKLFRGLRIPSSYLPTGTEDGSQTVNDGRVGTALIQEWRFNRYCIRLQSMICGKLDQEFKMFMRWRGINIDSQLFELRLNEPQNFAQYRQTEVDAARISTYTQLEPLSYFSKRFLMKRYLGLNEQEMHENEEMWLEEQGETKPTEQMDVGLRSVGITPGSISGDLSQIDSLPAAGEIGALGGMPGEIGAPGGMPAAGGQGGGAPGGIPAGPTGVI
jgi:hypothetical protein